MRVSPAIVGAAGMGPLSFLWSRRKWHCGAHAPIYQKLGRLDTNNESRLRIAAYCL